MQAYRRGRLAAFALIFSLALLRPLAAAAEPAPDMAAARQAVYGGALWRSGGNAFFGGASTLLHVHEVFRAAYREQAQDKLMLVYQLTPGPREQYVCHSCRPALGAAVLALDAQGGWHVQARSQLLMWGAPFSGPEDLQLIALGPQRWGLRSRDHDVAQGFESRRERVVVVQQQRLLLALDEGFTEAPGPGACGPGAAAQSTALQGLSGTDEAPRLELILRYNEGACPAPAARVERRRYALRDGRFQPE